MDECTECGSSQLKFFPALSQTGTAPAESAGWECQECGAWMDEEEDNQYYEED